MYCSKKAIQKRLKVEALQDYPTLLIKTGIVANAIEYHFTINWFEMNF